MIDGTDFEQGSLLAQPLKRVGYSDRTGWLIAVMSELGYLRFEGADGLSGLLDDLARAVGQERPAVAAALAPCWTREERKRCGPAARNGWGASSTPSGSTFCARSATTRRRRFSSVCRSAPGRAEDDGARLPRDGEEALERKTDLRVALTAVAGRRGHIHAGFLDAYDAVRSQIEAAVGEHPGAPLLVTGHSLGGALAVVATRFLHADSLAACYTFGGPRVGDRELSCVFKTPIYRLVNAAGAVPRVPFGSGMWLAAVALRGLIFRVLRRCSASDFHRRVDVAVVHGATTAARPNRRRIPVGAAPARSAAGRPLPGTDTLHAYDGWIGQQAIV